MNRRPARRAAAPLTIISGFAVSTLALLAVATPAEALSKRTFVAANGTNSGACALTAPCRTLAYALTQTSDDGTISVLSSGNYGGVLINKPVAIVAEGVEAMVETAVSCSPAGTAAICVHPIGTGTVTLRGLSIVLAQTSTKGVTHLGRDELMIQNCLIRGASTGLYGRPIEGNISVSNCTIADNITGIDIARTTSNTVRVVLDRVNVENNELNGIQLGSSTSDLARINATIRDSVIARNGLHGLFATSSGATARTTIMVDNATISANASVGILSSGPNTTIFLNGSTVTANATGVQNQLGGLMATYGNNRIEGNLNADGSPNETASFK